MATVTSPSGRTVQPDEILMQILCNGDNDRSLSVRSLYIIDAPRVANDGRA